MLDSMAGCGEGTAPCRSSGMLPVIAWIVVVRFLLWTVFLRTRTGIREGRGLGVCLRKRILEENVIRVMTWNAVLGKLPRG